MSEEPTPTRNWRRHGMRIFVVACVLWTLHYPRRMDRLYRAIPPDVTVGSYNHRLIRGWQKSASNPAIIGVLEKLGIEDAAELQHDSGIFHTIYWLTGRHSVFGLRYSPGDAFDQIGLCGASYVGWKARPMEFLKVIRWIPGLGRLRVSPAGSYYLADWRSKRMRRLGMVLSLDIHEGVLLGVLSQDPDAVQELSRRLRYDAPPAGIFLHEGAPWRTRMPVEHRFWVAEEGADCFSTRLVSARLDIVSLAPDKIELTSKLWPSNGIGWQSHWSFGHNARASGARIPDAGVFGAAAISGPLLREYWPQNWPALATADGHPWIALEGAPYRGRLLGLPLPSAMVRLPYAETQPVASWCGPLLEQVGGAKSEQGKLHWRLPKETTENSTLLLDTSKLGKAWRMADADSIFASAEGTTLTLGTHWESHLRQCRDSATAAPFTQLADGLTQNPEAAAWAWLDLRRANAELRGLEAVYRLATRFGGVELPEEQARYIEYGLTALKVGEPLGRLEAILTPNPEAVELKLRAHIATD